MEKILYKLYENIENNFDKHHIPRLKSILYNEYISCDYNDRKLELYYKNLNYDVYQKYSIYIHNYYEAIISYQVKLILIKRKKILDNFFKYTNAKYLPNDVHELIGGYYYENPGEIKNKYVKNIIRKIFENYFSNQIHL